METSAQPSTGHSGMPYHLAVVLILALLLGCDRPIYGSSAMAFSLVNNSDESVECLTAYEDSPLLHGDVIAAHSSPTAHIMIRRSTIRLVCQTLDGRKVSDQTYRWADLNRQESRPIVIVVAGPPDGTPEPR